VQVDPCNRTVICFKYFTWRCLPIAKKDSKNQLINEAIRENQIRVVDSDGSQLGLMSSKDAQHMAYERDLDLVMISPNASPPVCKIMDYGKYNFEQAKREKEARKNQHVVELKEIRLGLNIDKHDFDTKAGHATRFLQEGNKVKVSIRFRGRELGHPEIGLNTMARFAEALAEVANVDKAAKMDGRTMLMFLSSKAAAK